MANGIPEQHAGYAVEMRILFAEINSVTDSATDDKIQALHGLNISELLGFEDDGGDEDGPDDILIPLKAGNAFTKDYHGRIGNITSGTQRVDR